MELPSMEPPSMEPSLSEPRCDTVTQVLKINPTGKGVARICDEDMPPDVPQLVLLFGLAGVALVVAALQACGCLPR